MGALEKLDNALTVPPPPPPLSLFAAIDQNLGLIIYQMCTFFLSPFWFWFVFLEDRRMTEQRDRGTPAQPILSCCSTFPQQTHSLQGPRGGGCWLPTPPLPVAPLLLLCGKGSLAT